MRLLNLLLSGLLSCSCAAQGESSNDRVSPPGFPTLERIGRAVPGFAGVTRAVAARDGLCLQLGSVFPALAQHTLAVTEASGAFPGFSFCPDLERVPYSFRTLARVATQIQTEWPAVRVSVDTGLNRVVVPHPAAVLAHFPDLAPYLVDEQERPAYQVSVQVEGGVARVRIRNLLNRRIAVQPFCGSPWLQVWRGATLLQSGPEVACSQAEHLTVLRPHEAWVLTAEPSTPLGTLEPGRYVLRLSTDDAARHRVQLDWLVK